jgi:hypothetical protein
MWGNVYWPVYLIAASVAFGGPELYAVATNSANTLSEYSWTELGVGSIPVHNIAWWLSLAVWWTFVLAITAHIWWRGW